MLSSLKWLMLFLLPLRVWADLTIFEVRKNLPMSDSDPIYRDFIINGGSESGLSVGMIVTVQRRLPLYDSYQNRSAGDLQLKVAKIKVIHVQKGLSVARLQSEFTREGNPILEDNFIMVGDRLDMGSATSGSDKKAESSVGESNPKSAASDVVPAKMSTAVASTKTGPTIVINSVELSSKASPPSQPNTLSQQSVNVQVLQ